MTKDLICATTMKILMYWEALLFDDERITVIMNRNNCTLLKRHIATTDLTPKNKATLAMLVHTFTRIFL